MIGTPKAAFVQGMLAKAEFDLRVVRTFADGAWRACRLDGGGSVLTGRMPDELNPAIRADWSRTGRS